MLMYLLIEQVKEVKNGRLAMLACLGFAAQYAATNKDPFVRAISSMCTSSRLIIRLTQPMHAQTNLAEHLADPWHVTFATNGALLPS